MKNKKKQNHNFVSQVVKKSKSIFVCRPHFIVDIIEQNIEFLPYFCVSWQYQKNTKNKSKRQIDLENKTEETFGIIESIGLSECNETVS